MSIEPLIEYLNIEKPKHQVDIRDIIKALRVLKSSHFENDEQNEDIENDNNVKDVDNKVSNVNNNNNDDDDDSEIDASAPLDERMDSEFIGVGFDENGNYIEDDQRRFKNFRFNKKTKANTLLKKDKISNNNLVGEQEEASTSGIISFDANYKNSRFPNLENSFENKESYIRTLLNVFVFYLANETLYQSKENIYNQKRGPNHATLRRKNQTDIPQKQTEPMNQFKKTFLNFSSSTTTGSNNFSANKFFDNR